MHSMILLQLLGRRIHAKNLPVRANLPPALASAARLLELIRAHWALENRLHWRRDLLRSPVFQVDILDAQPYTLFEREIV